MYSDIILIIMSTTLTGKLQVTFLPSHSPRWIKYFTKSFLCVSCSFSYAEVHIYTNLLLYDNHMASCVG